VHAQCIRKNRILEFSHSRTILQRTGELLALIHIGKSAMQKNPATLLDALDTAAGTLINRIDDHIQNRPAQ